MAQVEQSDDYEWYRHKPLGSGTFGHVCAGVNKVNNTHIREINGLSAVLTLFTSV